MPRKGSCYCRYTNPSILGKSFTIARPTSGCGDDRCYDQRSEPRPPLRIRDEGVDRSVDFE